MGKDKDLDKVIDRLMDDEYIEDLKDRIAEGRANHIEKFLWEHRFGKPAEKVVLEAGGTLGELAALSLARRKQEALEAGEESEEETL